MSVLRAQGDRGPAEAHLLDRFSTTYSTSYRPYDEPRRIVPIQCVHGTKQPAGQTETASHVSRANRFWPISAEQGGHVTPITRSGDATVNTVAPYQPSITRLLNPLSRSTTDYSRHASAVSGGVCGRRSWDDTALVTGTDRSRPKPPGLSVSGTAPYRSVNVGGTDPIIANTASSAATATSLAKDANTRNYTSTYTTVVSDKLNPCFAVANDCAHVKSSQNTDRLTSSSSQCVPPPRTLATVAPNCGPRSDYSCTDLSVSKLSISPPSTTTSSSTSSPLIGGPFAGVHTTNSTSSTCQPTERSLTLTPVPSYPPSTTQFDFGQMFSQIARINNHLFLSSLNALTPDRLRQHGITLLVSAMIDPPPTQLRNAVASSVHVPVEDMEGANLRVHFDRVADRIAAEHRRGGRALVHCMAGVSRSSSLVLAYLMRHQNMSLAEAYQHVRGIRPCIQPNPGFWRQLLDYEERIRGTRSVRLLPPLGYTGTCSIAPTGTGRLAYATGRQAQRPSYLDMFTRNTGDLLPYRPLTTLHSIDSGKPYIGCRQPLG